VRNESADYARLQDIWVIKANRKKEMNVEDHRVIISILKVSYENA